MALDVRVLGPLAVESGESTVNPRPAQRRLLSILALSGGSRVSTEVLIDRFWPTGPPETARAAIQTHVSALRRQLGHGVLVTEGYGYRLDLDNHVLDVDEFDRDAETALKRRSQRDWSNSLTAASAALELWRGDPFPDLQDDEFAMAEISRLSEVHLELLEAKAECLIALDRADEALSDLEGLVVDNPYRERLWEHLMTARYKLGRHTEALRAYEELQAHLAEIGVEPGEPLRRLEEKILLHDKSLIQTKHNLPTELDTFIGRENELEEIVRLVDRSRLLTLTGAGGSGKTRLALQTAVNLLDKFPDGVWLVELADIDDAGLIPSAVATAMGLAGDEDLIPTLIEALSTGHTLLILDNCEHMAEGVSDLVTTLLGASPDLNVLSTSRQPLRTSGEHLFHVPGLALRREDALESDCIRLFELRAHQADPLFDVSKDLELVVGICKRLDAMPLGIELAAARVSSLGIEEIERHLDSALGFLTSGGSTGHQRHRTLEAAIAWSYRLASEAEQEALALLAVFRGGFDLDMAVWMLGEDAPSLVAELIDQSLLTTYRGAVGRRYRILETIRQFGWARATEDGVKATAELAHAEWCVAFVDRIWEAWQRPRFDLVEYEIHEEFENLLAGFERAESTGDRQLAGRIAGGLLWHWQTLGYSGRALQFHDRALETCEDDERRIGLLGKRANVRFISNDPDGALADAEAAYKLAGSVGPSTAKAYAISSYAHLYAMRPDLDASKGLVYAEEAIAIATATENDLLVAVLELDLALALAWAGRGPESRTALERAIHLVEQTEDPLTVAYAYTQAATVAMQLADFRRKGLSEFSNLLMHWLELHPKIGPRFRMGWIEWAMIQRGDLAEIEANLEQWSREDHLEGFQRLGNLVPLGTALWMQGRLEEAYAVVEECEVEGVNPRWYHDFIPLKVDVLVDLGRLEEAKAAAAIYLDFETDSSEEGMKLGVLNPLVRGVADLADSASDDADLVASAESYVDRMRQILAEHPRPMDGSVAMETPRTHLLFAEAELTRINQPDSTAWRAAMKAADYIYFRLYAQIRLGESLLTAGRLSPGHAQLGEALADSQRIGAARLAHLAETVLSG